MAYRLAIVGLHGTSKGKVRVHCGHQHHTIWDALKMCGSKPPPDHSTSEAVVIVRSDGAPLSETELTEMERASNARDVAAAVGPDYRVTYTVEVRNAALGSSRCRGTFSHVKLAQDYCAREAARSRSFVTFQPREGTPKNPGRAVGQAVKGED